MSVADDLFGVAYLTAEEFRSSTMLFGVEMSFVQFPNDTDGNKALDKVLQAASRAIDAYCGKTFTPDDLSETHPLDPQTWQFSVNNPPVASISSCVLRYAIEGTLTIETDRLFINNQQGYVEISRSLDGTLMILDAINAINLPQVEITYKSLQSVPNPVKLATGFQAGHLINSGFVDATIPANFGKLDIQGMALNNKKGYRSSEELRAGSISADAERLLQQYQRFVAA